MLSVSVENDMYLITVVYLITVLTKDMKSITTKWELWEVFDTYLLVGTTSATQYQAMM